MPTLILLGKAIWKLARTRTFWIVVAILSVALAVVSIRKTAEARDQIKTLQQGIDLVENENAIVAIHVKNLETERDTLLANNKDLNDAWNKTREALKGTQARLEAVLSASTGPIIIHDPSITSSVGTQPTSVSSSTPVVCVLKVGDSASIEVGELVLRTELDNFVISGAAWVENSRGQKLFGGSFSKDKTSFKLLDDRLKSDSKEKLSILSIGGAAVFTGKSRWMFGPEFDLHLGERLNVGGSVGVGSLDYYGMAHASWRF